jgi:hypothetical protein
MAYMGLTLDDYAEENLVEVWPDNVQAINAFVAMATQWRVGPGGPIGLDYSALPHVLRLTKTPRADWPDIFDSLRVLEDAALETMRED